MPKNNKNIHISQIFIELTNLCNFSCVFCPDDKMTRKNECMDPLLAKRLINEIADNGISQKIVFCLMGEPLMYPHIFEILQYAVDKNIKVTLSTNGALLSKENIDRLLKIPLDILQVSLQTPTAESFKLRRGNPNLTYEKYIDGIKAILERKIKIGGRANLDLLFMDTGFNLSRLFLNGSNNLKVKVERRQTKRLVDELLTVAAAAEDKQKQADSLAARVNDFIEGLSSDLKRFFFGNYKKKVARGVEFTFGSVHNWGGVMANARVLPAAFGSCNALTDQFAILCNGDYSLCCKDYNGDLVIGNAYKQSLLEILTSERARKIKKDFSLCRLNFKRCRICRGGTNIAELALKQIFTSLVYNTRFILRFLKKLVLSG